MAMPEIEKKSDPKDKLVLIVDDEEGVQTLFEAVLAKEGFRSEKVGDGAEAVQKVKELKPDLILLDLMLPHYGGFEILRKLQEDDISGIPIIIITARSLDRSTTDLIKQESNVVEFMEKPVNVALLAALCHKVLKTAPARAKIPRLERE